MKALLFLAALLPCPLLAHPDPSHTLEHLEEHLAETPDDLALLREKAELLLSTGHPELSAPVIARLLELAPQDPQNLLLDARLSHSRSDLEAAGKKARALTTTLPDFAPGWNLLSRVEHEARHQDQAIQARLTYLRLATRPGPTDVMTGATWLLDRGRPGDDLAALEVLDRGIIQLGNLTGLQFAAIEIEVGMARYDSALARLDALAARYRPSVDLAIRRATILEKAGRHQEAATACDNAIAMMEALPAKRKKKPVFKTQLKEVIRRKQENLSKATGN